jgi:hypothetical protein
MTRDDLRDALTNLDDTMGRIARKMTYTGWSGLRTIEQSLYLHGLRVEVRRGGGRVVRIAGAPAIWTAFDEQMHGGCRFPMWAA